MGFDQYDTLSAEGRKKAIKDWVLSFGLTSQQIADIVGISRRTIENWRRGGNAPTPFIIPFLKKAEPKLKRLAAKK